MKEFWSEGLPKIFEQFDNSTKIVALFIVMFFIFLIILKGKINIKHFKIFLGFILLLFTIVFIVDRFSNRIKLSNNFILNEDFLDNNNDWNIGQKQRTNSKISNGFLYLSSYQNAWYPLSIFAQEILSNDNIEISTKFKIINSSNGYGGIDWGMDNKQNRLASYLKNPKNLFLGIQNKSNKIDALIDWSENLNINQDDFNEIKIRNVGSNTEFFINGAKIFVTEKLPLVGGRVGFSVFNAQIVVDYITIKKL